MPGRRKWQPTPVFLPGKFHGQRSLMGYSPWGCKELGTTEWLNQQSQGVEFWQREETEQNRKMKVKNDMCGFFLCYMGTGYSGKSCMLYVIAVAHFPHCQWVCVHIIIYWMMCLKGFIKSLLTARRCASHYKVGKTSKISSYLEFGIEWILLLTNKQTKKLSSIPGCLVLTLQWPIILAIIFS